MTMLWILFNLSAHLCFTSEIHVPSLPSSRSLKKIINRAVPNTEPQGEALVQISLHSPPLSGPKHSPVFYSVNSTPSKASAVSVSRDRHCCGKQHQRLYLCSEKWPCLKDNFDMMNWNAELHWKFFLQNRQFQNVFFSNRTEFCKGKQVSWNPSLMGTC